MESKYYTPEPEEFNVGFEYELMDLALNMVDKEFRSDVITHGGDIDNALEWIKTNEVRVKYLDRGDIESEGWGVNMRGYSGEGQGHNGPVTFERYVKGEYELMHFSDNTVHIFQPYDDQRVNTKFEGTIKNKSELKKLLKQLGI